MNNELYQQFLEDRRRRGVKPESVANYKTYLKPFIEFCNGREPAAVAWEFLQRYTREATKKTAWTHMRIFSRWCADEGHGEDWAVRLRFRFGKPSQTPVLTIDEFMRIMNSMPNTWQARRDQAVFYCLFFTGTRRTAIVSLKVEDVNLQDRTIRVITKGSKEMFLTLPEVAAEALREWLELSRRLHSEWVFPSIRRPDKPICEQYITHCFPRYARAAGFERRVYVHLLRHSYATHLHRSGCTMETIQAALGHEQISTTANYIRRLGDAWKVREAVAQVFGQVEVKRPEPAPSGRPPQAKRRPPKPLTSADVTDWL